MASTDIFRYSQFSKEYGRMFTWMRICTWKITRLISLCESGGPMSLTVTEKKLGAFNLGKCWDAICYIAFQKMKMQICITKKLLVVCSWNLVCRKYTLIRKISQIFESGN